MNSKKRNRTFIFNKLDTSTVSTQLTIEIRVDINPFIKPLLLWVMKPKMDKKVIEMEKLIKELGEDLYIERQSSDLKIEEVI